MTVALRRENTSRMVCLSFVWVSLLRRAQHSDGDNVNAKELPSVSWATV